jgi:hypothetical protein
MPDMTFETAYTCKQNVQWETKTRGTKGDYYRVAYERLYGIEASRAGADYGWTCTCKGWHYRGTCRHVTKMKKLGLRCTWNEALDPGLEPERDNENQPCCPQCGGPVEMVTVAV